MSETGWKSPARCPTPPRAGVQGDGPVRPTVDVGKGSPATDTEGRVGEMRAAHEVARSMEAQELDRLSDMESRSLYMIREAYYQFRHVALLWSIGKDSTTLLWLIRKAFYDEIPFPVVHIDTTFKFPEMYAFRDRYAKEWGLNLIVVTNHAALQRGISYDTHDAVTCCHELKTEALKQGIAQYGFKALFVGIRRDEHGVRAKERQFSPRDVDFRWNYRDQPAELWDQFKDASEDETHMRVHPLLHWTELDIWKYIKREGIPVNSLYFSRDGKRYRSLGCQPITKPVESGAATVDDIIEEIAHSDVAERSGRAQDKEADYVMQKLRALGYM